MKQSEQEHIRLYKLKQWVASKFCSDALDFDLDEAEYLYKMLTEVDK